MTYSLRPLTAADAGMAARFVSALIGELSPGLEPDVAAMTRTAAALLATPAVTGLAASLDGRAVGLILLNECAAIYAGGRFGEITELYVEPAHRSRGVVRALVAKAVDIGRLCGWTRLEVGAPGGPGWARTRAFYERQGFAEVGPRLKRPLAGGAAP